MPDPYQEAALAALVSFLVHGLVDTLIVIPFLSLMMVIILGSGFPKQNRPDLGTNKRDKILLVVILGSVLLTGWFSCWQRSAIIKAVDHGNSQDWQSAAYYIEIASTKRPDSALVNQQKALIVSHLVDQNASSEFDQAVESFQQAARLDPTWAMNHAQLGRLLAAQGQHEAAVASLSKAVELAPRAPLIHLNLAVTAEEAGREDLARREYWSVLSLKRGWSESIFWQETPLRQRVYYDFQRWSSLDQGQVKSPPGELEQIKMLIRGGNYSQAEEKLHRFVLVRSIRGETTLEIMWMKAWLTFQRGDVTEAITLAERAFDGWRFQSSYGPGNQEGLQYGEKLYRIRGLEEDLIPQFIPAPWLDSWLDRMVIAGSWYQEIGEETRAVAIYQEVLQYNPGHKEAEAALGRLTE
jgi:tetratricopeptide (TPR) repeat protein